MDDLAGLDWSSSANSQTSKPPPMSSSTNFYPALRPTPSPFASGRNTPLSAQGSGSVGSKPASAAKPPPSQDSFSNLLSFATQKSGATSNLSLREQQERLEAEKRKKEEERRKQNESQYGNGQFWDTLGSGSNSRTASHAIPPPVAAGLATNKTDSDDDLFAAFKAETQVDNASFYPPPAQKRAPISQSQPASLNLSNPKAWSKPSGAGAGGFGDDDDPFGLNTLKSRPTTSTLQDDADEDDNLLGDLGRPVEEVKRKQQTSEPSRSRPEPGKPIETSDSDSDDEPTVARTGNDPFDKAVAQLVDFGFSPDDARRALTESDAGLNVQAAASWLLDDAHRKAKERSQGKTAPSPQPRERPDPRGRDGSPAWMRDEDWGEGRPRREGRSPAAGEADLAQTAAAMGSKAFKAANSLWKMGQKRVQQAVADFQQPEGDPNMPKWMRNAPQDRMTTYGKQAPDATDEAMMLESGGRPSARPSRLAPDSGLGGSRTTSRDQSPALSATSSGRNTPAPRWQQATPPTGLDARSRLGRLAAEDDNAAAYVSPNRRKKPVSQPASQPEPDLLFSDEVLGPSPSLPQRPRAAPPSRPAQSTQPVQAPSSAPRPAAPARQIPPVSAAALQTSHRHRLDGTVHFKRGDYAAAHASYSSSLTDIPPTHPLTIILLTNRALTSLKTGSPKQAVEDADAAIKIIGPSLGQGETVAVLGDSGAEEKREMKDLYGKALSRKAEALEQMERWADAGAVWQLCVETGVGGPTAIAGRQRCQSALAPKPKPAPRPAAAKPRPRPSPVASLGPQKSSEAVQRLREANQAAAKEDDEKFALSEKVDARIAAWRDGKRDNLRALLGSLDTVLWENSGWKKVGLHELVVANKVKIVYMKAIAKTHPDKLPQDASTEVRLIAGTVFSTLNEGWDKFKAENNL